MVGSLERVYEIGATYRAEPSATTRHMTEFTTVDVEMGFINSVKTLWKWYKGWLILFQKHLETHKRTWSVTSNTAYFKRQISRGENERPSRTI